MNLYDIESFLMVAEKRSISKAAEALSLTQPALSQRIKLLEAELGYTLLKRQKGGRTTELTEAGEAFITNARQIQSAWASALALGASAKKSTFSVTITDSVLTPTLAPANRVFARENPHLTFSVNSFRSSASPGYVEDGTVDLAITGAVDITSKELNKLPLYSEHRVFVCQKSAPYPEIVRPSMLDSKKQLTLLCNLEVIDWQEYWFSNGLSAVGSHITLDRIPYMDTHLFDGDVWAIVPISVAHLLERTIDVAIHPLEDGPPPRIVYTIQRFDNDSLAIQEYLDCVRRIIEANPDFTPLYKG